MSGPALDREFFCRPMSVVAAGLIGATIVCDAGTHSVVRARIVEVEAYGGLDDPASHAFRGPTPRSAIMFGPPGHLYVYLSYGLHHCANIVCEVEGVAGAVLLRAAAVTQGHEVVRRRRDPAGTLRPITDSALLRGPGNLCRGLGLTRADNGVDVCRAPGSRVRLESSPESLGAGIAVDVVPRVGISSARDLPLRFVHRGDPAVSSTPSPRVG